MLLGEYIKEYRATHGNMSQDTFATLSGLSKGYISMLERNQNPKSKLPIAPTVDTFRKVAKATGVSVNQLFEIIDSSVSLNDDISSSPEINEDDLYLLELFHRASDSDQEVIRLLLQKYEDVNPHKSQDAG